MPKAACKARTKPAPYPTSSPVSSQSATSDEVRTPSPGAAALGSALALALGPRAVEAIVKADTGADADTSELKVAGEKDDADAALIKAEEEEDELDESFEDDYKPTAKKGGKAQGSPRKRKASATVSKDKLNVKAEPKPKNGSEKAQGKSRGNGNPVNKRDILWHVFGMAKGDWHSIAPTVGLSHTQVCDLWRKQIHPNLLAGKAWSEENGTFSKEAKIRIVLAVLEQNKPDWKVVAANSQESSQTRIYDAWRKIILPRLKRGEHIE